jgi:predicted nucleotidyltransferase
VTAISLDLSKKPELIWLSRLVADIQVVAQERDLLLVGAQARDLLLMHAYRIDTRRATEDVDLAFMVGDWSQFLDLRTRLVEWGRFSELAVTDNRILVFLCSALTMPKKFSVFGLPPGPSMRKLLLGFLTS